MSFCRGAAAAVGPINTLFAFNFADLFTTAFPGFINMLNLSKGYVCFLFGVENVGKN